MTSRRAGIPVRALDFFCGAGGLTRGLTDAGIEVAAGIDNDPRLRGTYTQNNPGAAFYKRNTAELRAEDLEAMLGARRDDPVLYAACAPCQPFSSLNRKRIDETERTLILRFAELAAAVPPDFIVIENAPGLGTAAGRAVYKALTGKLEGAGFKTASGVLDAKDFGVPQYRRRFILTASRHGPARLPEPEKGRRTPTVRSAIGHFPPIPAGGRAPGVPNHASRPLPPHILRIVEAVPPDGGSRGDIEDEQILLPCHRRRPTAYRDVFGRMSWDEPCRTITGRCTDVYSGRFTHPEQHRGLSLREGAALMTFPDDYRFIATSFWDGSRQIGNAVPVKMAEALGRTVQTMAAEAHRW